MGLVVVVVVLVMVEVASELAAAAGDTSQHGFFRTVVFLPRRHDTRPQLHPLARAPATRCQRCLQLRLHEGKNNAMF